MNKSLDDISFIYHIAKQYYSGSYVQEEIAKNEFISRPQISRILKKARDLGIVHIEVRLPDLISDTVVAESLKNKYGLQKVIISQSQLNQSDTLSYLCETAAAYLSSELGKYNNVGIGWGKTIFEISLMLTQATQKVKNLTFCPVVGNSSVNNPFLQTTTIMDRFVVKFNANGVYFNVPTICHTNQVDAKRILELERYWEELDAVLFTVGGRAKSRRSYFQDELPKSFYSDELIDSIRFDILSTYFLDDMKQLKLPPNYSTISLPPPRLKKIKNAICICKGEDRIEGLLYALENEYINTLIIDSETAKCVLELGLK